MSRVHVRLSDEEVQKTKHIADLRSVPKEHCASTRRWEKSGNYHFHGMLGEVAYAKHYNVSHDEIARPNGDDGYDLSILGKTVDCKCVNYDPPILKLTSLKDFKCDLMALARRVDDNNIELCGFIDLPTFLQKCYSRDFGHGKRACVDESALFF